MADYLEQITPNLMQRLFCMMPENPQEHPEIEQLFFRETKEYVERWKMYNQFFRNIA